MKKLCAVMAGVLLASSLVGGAELVITQDSTTIEGGTYDMVDLSSRKYCTLRNVTVRNTTGQNYYAGIKMTGSKYITIENCVVDGGAQAVRGKGTCGGIKLDGASRVTIKNCKIHNLNDDGIRLFTATIVDIIGNDIYNLRSCGRENSNVSGCSQCVNGHSDGIQIIECIKVNVIGNTIRSEYGGTSGIFMGNSGLNCKDIVIANNLINTPQCYYTTYIWYVERFQIYNNVIWGYRSGGASIWYGVNMWDFELCNNIIKYVKFKNGGSYNGTEHTIRNNLFNTAFNYGSANLQGQDPQFTTTPGNTISAAMCALRSSSPCINKGMTGANVPPTDFHGNLRNGAPDIGAIEYNGIPPGDGEAKFTATPRSGVKPLRVTFTNTSTGDFTAWAWDFGDGGSSALKSPAYTYQNSGTYTVSLTASGGSGSDDTYTLTNYITVTDEPVTPTTITVEAEDMTLNGYKVDTDRLNGEGIVMTNTTTIPSTAEATYTFAGESGVWDIDLVVVPENDGNPNIKIYVNSTQVFSGDYPLGSHTMADRHTFTATGITINQGDVIKLVGTSDYLSDPSAAAFARVDKMVFDLVSSTMYGWPLFNQPQAPVEPEIMPNPMNDILAFESADFLLSDVSLAIYSAAGKLVHQYSGIGEGRQVIWNGLDRNGRFAGPGVYYYNLNINEKVFNGRIIKLK